jgi:multidrug resistance efflux pump
MRALNTRGVASQATLDDIIAANKAAAAEVDAQKARIAQHEAELEASALGLDFGGARTMGQPLTRLRELRSEVIDLEQQQQELRRSLEAEKAELVVIDGELRRQNKVQLSAPQSAVIWSIDARPGENVAGGSPILQLVDCRQIWVEAFFDESNAPAFAINQPVKVRLIHGGKLWTGTVETIRAGTGRVTVGDSVVLPPPEISRRQLPVRVITVRVKMDWASSDLQPGEFCLAGRSAEVILD